MSVFRPSSGLPTFPGIETYEDFFRERTKVHDLESDYYSLEFSPYLSEEERTAIVQRKEELRRMDFENSKRFVVDLDISGKRAEERKQLSVQRADDPIIQSILLSSKLRTTKPHFESNFLPESEEFAFTFVPRVFGYLFHESSALSALPFLVQGRRAEAYAKASYKKIPLRSSA